ncbi:RagB/SusD family nutrient uptake outer membrane protein [Chryseobacterium populi]|uniref:RagB/SusD family protein n=1 Tax=Chryseobacterium populi TaxID=1144316 RepID=J3CAM6_9FLAO|nr:RagB/SusD family nutrient uptake outer membrane protein [Chryseobacterium populi]EJL67626.1 RagB/SusD family protein [Chryseobacterium populi]
MKKIKYIVATLVFLTVVNSCDRELDQTSPQKVLTDDVFTDIAAFQSAEDAAYDAMKATGYFGGDTSQLGIPDEISDNLVISPTGRQTNFLAYNWNIASTIGSVTNLFIAGYSAISNANLPLKYINNLPDGAAKNDIIAQSRAIRAMIHFDLVRAYCKIPTQSSDANASIGIDYETTYDPFGKSEGRKLTVAQVYDKIIEDLNFAVNNITTSTVNKGRLTKPAVLGLLSRVYLYKGDYQNAINFGQQSIAASQSVGSAATFPLIWSSNNVDGVLFKVLNSTTEAVTTGVVYQQGATATGGNIRAEYVVPKSLYNLFADNDIRKTAYIRQSAYQGTLRNNVIKWAVNTGGQTPLNVVEVKYLRTAEVYLNVAESAYKTGNEALANSLLNTLKAERYTNYTPVTLTGTALWNEIMLQRRLELAFENDRFYTLKRLGLGLQRTGEGANIDGTGVPAVTQSVPASDYRWQWPIPQGSINKDPGLPQNTGY